MVSITPQFFYGFSPTTSSPHVTAITTFHESAITLLRSKSSIITLRLSTNTIFVFMHEKEYMHEKKYLHEFYVLLSATYSSKRLRNAVSDITQATMGCCLRNIYKFTRGAVSDIIWTLYSSTYHHWTKPTSLLLQNMLYKL